MARQIVSTDIIREARWATQTFSILPNDDLDITQAGVQYARQVTPPLWEMRATTVPLRFFDELETLIAKLNFYRGSRTGIPLYNLRRPTLRTYIGQAEPDDTNARITALSNGNATLTISGLSGVEAKDGDYVEVLRRNPTYPDWRTLHSVVGDATLGDTLTVYPAVSPTIASDIAAMPSLPPRLVLNKASSNMAVRDFSVADFDSDHGIVSVEALECR